jgi:ATP-dependent helicase HrpA
LLSNLCCRDELGGETVYRGSRGNRASIFPGSVLFRKGPRWLMAAELVQTTRLYARTCAKIETQWVEELASHVMTRTVSDPHFDKDLGDAAAWERATLAGAVIVPRRKVRLHEHDAAASRDLFIRNALVRGEYRGQAPFRVHNALALQKAEDAVARLRRHDVLRDESEIVAFFDSRLPPNVVGRESFDAYLESLGAVGGDQRSLMLSESNFIRPEVAARLSGGDFPDEVVMGESIFKLEYAFEPGKGADGVSVVVPLLELDQVDPQAGEWLVPGLMPELIGALVKGLSRGLRAGLEAAAKGDAAKIGHDVAQVLVQGANPLGVSLSESIEVLYGQKIAADEWSLAGVPDFLRLRYEVVDHAGRMLAEGRNWKELRERLAPRLEKAKAAAAGSGWAPPCVAGMFHDLLLPPTSTSPFAGSTITQVPRSRREPPTWVAASTTARLLEKRTTTASSSPPSSSSASS